VKSRQTSVISLFEAAVDMVPDKMTGAAAANGRYWLAGYHSSDTPGDVAAMLWPAVALPTQQASAEPPNPSLVQALS
jgi:hypothetical protein